MFQFPSFASCPYFIRRQDTLMTTTVNPRPELLPASKLQWSRVGFPIRKSPDQSLFAAPRSLSQRITSFIACACQGIHQMPLRHLIVLIANDHRADGHRRFIPARDNLASLKPGKTSFTRSARLRAIRRRKHMAAGWRPAAA
jgi:hypothetical protein